MTSQGFRCTLTTTEVLPCSQVKLSLLLEPLFQVRHSQGCSNLRLLLGTKAPATISFYAPCYIFLSWVLATQTHFRCQESVTAQLYCWNKHLKLLADQAAVFPAGLCSICILLVVRPATQQLTLFRSRSAFPAGLTIVYELLMNMTALKVMQTAGKFNSISLGLDPR